MSRLTIVVACAGIFGFVCAWPTPARAQGHKQPNLEPIELLTAVQAAAEAEIRQALDEKTEFDFNETSVSDIVKILKQRHKIDIQLDLRAMEDASIGPDTPVTRQVSGITLRSALRLMLGALDLTYIIKYEAILITTPDKAANEVVTKIYPVGDLATPNPAALGGEELDSIIDSITWTIAPTTWCDVGGPGSIKPIRQPRCLIVSQTEEVHEQIFNLLTALRKSRDAQPAATRLTAFGSVVDQLAGALRKRMWLDAMSATSLQGAGAGN